MRSLLRSCVIFGLLVTASLSLAQARRKVIIDQDCSGPGGSNLQTVLLLLQSQQVEVLGITVASGDQWRDEEVAHTLRLLEIIGRTDIPVVPGAVFPLVHSRQEAQWWQERYGKLAYMGAWDDRWWHEPYVVPPLPEGSPKGKPAEEDAAHFRIRMVHRYPHEVTIYEGAPMTDLALAISLNPQLPELAEQLVFMGGSLSPQSDSPEIHEQSAARIQLLVRSPGGVCRAASAMAQDHLHTHRHFCEDASDAGDGQTNRRGRHAHRAVLGSLPPAGTRGRIHVG